MYYWNSGNREWERIRPLNNKTVMQWVEQFRHVGIATCRPKNYSNNPFNNY